MHYKNGREAKVGDVLVGKDCFGQLVAGVLVETLPGAATCNGRVIPAQVVQTAPLINLGDCIHMDDITELNPPATLADAPF